jgi:hypothetical protein
VSEAYFNLRLLDDAGSQTTIHELTSRLQNMLGVLVLDAK